MGIKALGEILKAVNPHEGANPNQACMECAKQTGLALTTGKSPVRVENEGDTNVYIDINKQKKNKTFIRQEGRAAQVWTWLKNSAPPGVWAVDAGGHAWNFITSGWGGAVYLIDSSHHVFREINDPKDPIASVHVVNEIIPIRTDYADVGKCMDFYFWGPLNLQYSARVLA